MNVNKNDNILLDVTNLKKHFNLGHGRILKAVDDVSFQIKKGETLGLVGESGCGKSTCGRTVLGMYNKTSGQVLYNGKDVHSLKGQELFGFKREAQMIFQDPYASLDPRMTVSDIVAEGLDIHKMVKNQAERATRIYELLDMVGLNEDHANRFIHEFSGGQRQRIGIARAIVMQPEFIIADEPISALDVSIRAQVLNLLKKFQKEKGLTYLFIAHDLSVVRHVADRIAVLYKGKIVELAESEELFAHPLHAYTNSLLSAIPVPDPDIERNKTIIKYTPARDGKKRTLREVRPNHFVLVSDEEYNEMVEK